jgi:hypothetical protein
MRGIVHRPMAYVSLQSKDDEWYLFCPYVDSGADTSLFPKSDSSLLKMNLYDGEYRPILGVKMRIGETILNVSVAFADSDEVPRLLGRADLFKHFRIIFDEANLQTIFELRE